MNEIEAKLEQNRKDQERLKEEENKLLKEKEGKSRRFKVGQWFKRGATYGYEGGYDVAKGYFMLTQVSSDMVCLVGLDGNRWREPVKAVYYDITWEDIKKMYQQVGDLTPVNVEIKVI
jgi:hypothetical protein